VLTRNLANYTTGVVRIKITGVFPEKFINLCLSEGILLWGIKKEGEEIYANVRLPDFFAIRKPALKSRVKVRVLGVRGLPFTLKRVKRRRMLIAGAVLFLVLLQILTSYIWFVDVAGVKNVSGDRIKSIAAAHGLHPGAVKSGIKAKEIENSITLAMPEVAWVGVRLTGTRAIVEIVEKTMPRTEDKSPADVVALKDGIITEIIALSGQPMVKKGDTVKRGDVLIKGIVPPPSEENAEIKMPVSPPTEPRIRANGIVKARVWYEGYGEAGLVREEYHRTGNRKMSVSLKIGNTVLDLKKAEAEPFPNFESEEIFKKFPSWRNTGFVVETKIDIFYELVIDRFEVSPEEARDMAKEQAVKILETKIPETAEVLVRNSEVLSSSEPGLTRVKVFIETVEDIGYTQVAQPTSQVPEE